VRKATEVLLHQNSGLWLGNLQLCNAVDDLLVASYAYRVNAYLAKAQCYTNFSNICSVTGHFFCWLYNLLGHSASTASITTASHSSYKHTLLRCACFALERMFVTSPLLLATLHALMTSRSMTIRSVAIAS
jgi:hypothetical protein